MSSRKNPATDSEVSRRVSALRKSLKMSQEEFAANVGVGRIAALHWESGRSQPSSDAYVKMAKLAKDVDHAAAAWFWQQIGVDKDALRDLFPEFEKSIKDAERRVRKAVELVAENVLTVPILSDVASVGSPAFAAADNVEAWFPLPSVLVPHPEKTSCVRAPKDYSALFGEDLVVVDSTELPTEKLYGQMVIAERKSSSKVYVGFLQKFEMGTQFIQALSMTKLNEGLNLNRVISNDLFADAKPNHPEPKKKAAGPLLVSPGLLLAMTPPADWRILGRAIGWVSYAQPGAFSLLKRAKSGVDKVKVPE